jgi:hypothetical protein
MYLLDKKIKCGALNKIKFDTQEEDNHEKRILNKKNVDDIMYFDSFAYADRVHSSRHQKHCRNKPKRTFRFLIPELTG